MPVILCTFFLFLFIPFACCLAAVLFLERSYHFFFMSFFKYQFLSFNTIRLHPNGHEINSIIAIFKKCPSFTSSSNLSSSSVPFASAQSLSHIPPSLSPFSRTVRARHGAQPTSAVSRQHAALWRSAVVSEPENPGAERTAPRRGVVGIPAGRMGKGANRFGMFFLVLFFLLFFCCCFTFII